MRQQGLIGRLGLVGLLGGVVVVGDLLTKRWASQTFASAPRTIIDPILTFTYTENPGSAFSLIREGGAFLAGAAFVALGIVIASVWKPRPTAEVVGFGLIAGGAVGNLVDRIARGEGWFDGKVIDWIQFPNFPVFNIADSAITVGVVLLLLVSWRQS